MTEETEDTDWKPEVDRRALLRAAGTVAIGSAAVSTSAGAREEDPDEETEEDRNAIDAVAPSSTSADGVEPASGDNWSPTEETIDLGSEGAFHNGITAHDGEVYTLDNDSNRVYRYTTEFELLEEIDPPFEGSGLHRGITYHAGNWYTVRQSDGINVFDEEWNFEQYVEITDQIYDIRWYDDRFYVSDRDGYIHEYTEDLDRIETTDIPESAGTGPMYVIEGTIYALDFRGDVVYQYSTDYELEEIYELDSEFDRGPTGIGLIEGKWYLNDDSDGELFEYYSDYDRTEDPEVNGTVYVGSVPGEVVTAETEPDETPLGGPGIADAQVGTADIDAAGPLNAVDAATGDQEWVFTETDSAISSSPTVVDGVLYVGSSDGNVFATDAETGDQEWTFTEPSSTILSSPSVVGGTVYIGSDDPAVYAIDAQSGDEEWRFTDLGGSVSYASPNVIGGTLYIATTDGALYAIDADTGDQEWLFTGLDEWIDSSPTVYEDTVYVGSSVGALHAIDATTGLQEWVFDDFDGGALSPTVVNDKVYFTSAGADTGVYAIDAETGEEEWNFTTADSPRSSPTVYEGSVFVGSDDPAVYAIDADTGEEEWSFTGMETVVDSSPTAHEDTVYIGSQDGYLFALDADTGTVQWEFAAEGPVISSPTIVEEPSTGDSAGSRVSLGTLGHHDDWTGEDPDPSPPDDPSVEQYADADGIVRSDGVIEAFLDWQAGEIDSVLLIEVFQAWQSGDPVA